MQYLHDQQINGYIPDNRFRSRDPKFAQQKDKYGTRHQNQPDTGWKDILPASDFQFGPVNLTGPCPAGESLKYHGTRTDQNGQSRAYFQGRLLQCRHCPKTHQCMQNPEAANHRKGKGRQVSFTLENKRLPNYTDWMKHRVDSRQGKEIYSHRMSVVEPVFGNIGTNKRLNRFQFARQEAGTGPVAAILPGAQYREAGELRTVGVGGVNAECGRPGKWLLEASNAGAGNPKGRNGWLNIRITLIGQLMATIEITKIRRWERLGIGFFYTLVSSYSTLLDLAE